MMMMSVKIATCGFMCITFLRPNCDDSDSAKVMRIQLGLFFGDSNLGLDLRSNDWMRALVTRIELYH